MRMLRQLPNFITLLNLLCGCIAVVYAFDGNYSFAFGFVALGIFFDFFDGFFARILNASSPLGLQLDSLADMVTSGVTPGVTMFFLLSQAVQLNGFSLADPDLWICLVGFIITLGSCFRLAKFNIDTRQTDSFIGLPTPANALFILSLPMIRDGESLLLFGILMDVYALIAISIFSAFILNAEIPLFSLKIKKFSLQRNWLQIAFLSLSLLLLIALGIAGVPIIIMSYILISVINNRFTTK